MNKQSLIKSQLVKAVSMSVVLLLALTGCKSLFQAKPLQTRYYTLQMSNLARAEPNVMPSQALLSLSVSIPKAASGNTTRRIMYTRQPHQLEYFAHNEWVDTPANMLHTLLVNSIASTGQFKAVVHKQSLIKSEIRLESEIVQLIQNFHQSPSYVQFILRATLINNLTSKVIATRDFHSQINSTSDDPIAGVEAANRSVNVVLSDINQFISQVLVRNQPLFK